MSPLPPGPVLVISETSTFAPPVVCGSSCVYSGSFSSAALPTSITPGVRLAATKSDALSPVFAVRW